MLRGAASINTAARRKGTNKSQLLATSVLFESDPGMKFRSSNSFSNMELLMARGSQFYLRQKNPLGKFHAAAARARQVRLRTFKRFRDIVRLASESFDAVSRRFYVITIVIQVTLTRERCKYKDSHSSSLSFVFISLVKIGSLSGTRAVT